MSKAPFTTEMPPPPAKRPKCPACDALLRPVIETTQERDHDAEGYRLKTTAQAWRGRYHSYGAFCTLRCCESFANAAHRAGYRITKR